MDSKNILLLYPPETKFGGILVSPCLSVYLTLDCGLDFVYTCSKTWVHGFF